jgi:predicted nuclease with TOPRIM domain
VRQLETALEEKIQSQTTLMSEIERLNANRGELRDQIEKLHSQLQSLDKDSALRLEQIMVLTERAAQLEAALEEKIQSQKILMSDIEGLNANRGELREQIEHLHSRLQAVDKDSALRLEQIMVLTERAAHLEAALKDKK